MRSMTVKRAALARTWKQPVWQTIANNFKKGEVFRVRDLEELLERDYFFRQLDEKDQLLRDTLALIVGEYAEEMRLPQVKQLQRGRWEIAGPPRRKKPARVRVYISKGFTTDLAPLSVKPL